MSENSPDITVDLEHARSLKEAGWVQEDLYVWSYASVEDEDPELRQPLEWHIYPKGLHDACVESWKEKECLAAPTAEEVLRRLPLLLEEKAKQEGQIAIRHLRICPCEEGWKIYYKNHNRSRHKTSVSTKADTLANAAAAMFVFLSENNLLPSA